jgi:hypothetical protein
MHVWNRARPLIRNIGSVIKSIDVKTSSNPQVVRVTAFQEVKNTVIDEGLKYLLVTVGLGKKEVAGVTLTDNLFHKSLKQCKGSPNYVTDLVVLIPLGCPLLYYLDSHLW